MVPLVAEGNLKIGIERLGCSVSSISVHRPWDHTYQRECEHMKTFENPSCCYILALGSFNRKAFAGLFRSCDGERMTSVELFVGEFNDEPCKTRQNNDLDRHCVRVIPHQRCHSATSRQVFPPGRITACRHFERTTTPSPRPGNQRPLDSASRCSCRRLRTAAPCVARLNLLTCARFRQARSLRNGPS